MATTPSPLIAARDVILLFISSVPAKLSEDSARSHCAVTCLLYHTLNLEDGRYLSASVALGFLLAFLFDTATLPSLSSLISIGMILVSCSIQRCYLTVTCNVNGSSLGRVLSFIVALELASLSLFINSEGVLLCWLLLLNNKTNKDVSRTPLFTTALPAMVYLWYLIAYAPYYAPYTLPSVAAVTAAISKDMLTGVPEQYAAAVCAAALVLALYTTYKVIKSIAKRKSAETVALIGLYCTSASIELATKYGTHGACPSAYLKTIFIIIPLTFFLKNVIASAIPRHTSSSSNESKEVLVLLKPPLKQQKQQNAIPTPTAAATAAEPLSVEIDDEAAVAATAADYESAPLPRPPTPIKDFFRTLSGKGSRISPSGHSPDGVVPSSSSSLSTSASKKDRSKHRSSLKLVDMYIRSKQQPAASGPSSSTPTAASTASPAAPSSADTAIVSATVGEAVWSKRFSETYKRHYWKNETTNETTWRDPRKPPKGSKV